MLIVASNLAQSRSQAQALIRAGRVRVDGHLVDKPGTAVSKRAHLQVNAPPRYVSRGGDKLQAALGALDIDVRSRTCLDVGASTGGFTDCLLQHGAARVYAVDVGKGILDWKLRRDTRVVVREELNARFLEPKHIPEAVDLAAVDVAFISLRLVLPAVKQVLAQEGEVLALVKPQFEAGRGQVGRRGVVRDPAVHLEVLEKVRRFSSNSLGWSLRGAVVSPLPGPAGNLEFFFHLLPAPRQPSEVDLAALVSSAHAQLSRSKGGDQQ